MVVYGSPIAPARDAVRPILVVPKPCDPFERICDAVVCLQRRAAIKAVLCPVGSRREFAAAAPDSDPGRAIAVLVAPARESARGWKTLLCEVASLRQGATDLPLLLVLETARLHPTTSDRDLGKVVRELAGLGVDEVVLDPDESTPIAVAQRVMRMKLSPLSHEFLRIVPESFDAEWFVVCRMLEEWDEGLQLGHAWVAEQGEKRVLEIWRDRIELYGAILAATERSGRPSSRPDDPPSGLRALDPACRRLTGNSVSKYTSPDGWQILLDDLARRIADDAASLTERRPWATSDPSRPEPSEFPDRETLEKLLEMHREAAIRSAHQVLGSWDDAEDAVQEVFIRVWRLGSDKWREINQTYLTRAARNQALDQFRSRRRYREARHHDHVEAAGREADAAASLEVMEAARLANEPFKDLPPRQLVAGWLSFARQWPSEDIQQLLDITPSSFRNLRRRAKSKLIRVLSDPRAGDRTAAGG